MPGVTLFQRLVREPLIVFMGLGALIFVADSALESDRGASGARQPIVVSAERIEAFRSSFIEREGHRPTDAEVRRFIDNWVEREALYRQARALGLDENDRLIRRQMIRKMRYLLEDAQPLPEPTRAELRDWLRSHPKRYGKAPTVSFEHVYIDRGRANAQAIALDWLERLRRGATTPSALGDAFPGKPSIRAATPADLAKRFGGGFRDQLAKAAQGRWHGPIQSRMGLHLVRVTERTPFKPATVESAGKRLRVEYQSHRRKRANARAVQSLRARFDVRIEEPS